MDPLRTRTIRSLAALVALAPLVLAPPAVAAGAGESERELGGWTRVILEGRKFLFATGKAEIARHDDACGDGRELVTIDSMARVFGARAGEHFAASVLAPSGVRSHGWMELSPGRKARRARLDRAAGSYELAVYRPGESGGERDVESWPRTEHHEWLIEPDEAGDGDGDRDGFGPADLYGVLGRLGELAAREKGELAVLTKNGVARLLFDTVERQRMKIRVRDLDSGRLTRMTPEVVAIDLTSVDGENGETLLRMKGATRVWVEPASGALVRIEGRGDGERGTLALEISGVSFEPATAPDLFWPGDSRPAACGEPVAEPHALDDVGADS